MATCWRGTAALRAARSVAHCSAAPELTQLLGATADSAGCTAHNTYHANSAQGRHYLGTDLTVAMRYLYAEADIAEQRRQRRVDVALFTWCALPHARQKRLGEWTGPSEVVHQVHATGSMEGHLGGDAVQG